MNQKPLALALLWLGSLMFGIYMSYEVFLMYHGKELVRANEMIQQCNKVIAVLE